MPIYDLTCPNCEHKEADALYSIAEVEAGIKCPKCDTVMVRDNAAPNIFTTIVPTTKTSKPLKAGHQHKYVNRPAEKTQVGYGGSVSSDHPTGSTKNKD
jgi:transposase